jgi:hypothetical protein
LRRFLVSISRIFPGKKLVFNHPLKFSEGLIHEFIAIFVEARQLSTTGDEARYFH